MLVVENENLVATIEARARERQGTRTDIRAPVPESSEKGNSTAVLAKMAGVGETTVKQARKVAEKGTAEQKEAVRAGRTSVSSVTFASVAPV